MDTVVPESLLLLYHLVMVHSLWYAPIYAWLLLVSGWARRAPFLWAVLPPLAIGVVEKVAFNTSHFAAMLANRISGDTAAVISTGYHADGSDDTPHPRSFPEQPGSMDRTGSRGGLPRHSGPAAALSRPDLRRSSTRSPL